MFVPGMAEEEGGEAGHSLRVDMKWKVENGNW